MKGVDVPIKENHPLIRGNLEDLDDLPEQAFYLVATIDDARAKAAELAKDNPCLLRLKLQPPTPQRMTTQLLRSISGFLGQMGALEGHAQLLTLSKPGVITIMSDRGTERYLMGKALRNSTPLPKPTGRSLETVDSIDKDKARSELIEAEEELSRTAPADERHQFVVDRVELARAALKPKPKLRIMLNNNPHVRRLLALGVGILLFSGLKSTGSENDGFKLCPHGSFRSWRWLNSRVGSTVDPIF